MASKRQGLQRHMIEERTPEWFEFRRNGIGGSEVGAILRLDPYQTAAQIYAEKVGVYERRREDVEATFWGRKHEDDIADSWQYWNGTKEGYIQQYNSGNIVRKCRKINAIIVNPKYPWLFGSLDRFITKDSGVNMITGEPLDDIGILELKTLSYWGSRVWEDGIPIYYLAQIHQYMIIMECDYAEIAILRDGSKFDVEYIQRDEQLCQKILNITHDFWFNRVLPAKEAFRKREEADMRGNLDESEKWNAQLHQLEPPPDETAAYEQFMNEKFVKERDSIQGTVEIYDLCKRDVVLRRVIARASKTRRYFRNILVKYIIENGVENIDFGKLGNVNYVRRRNNRNKTLTINIKEKPPQAVIDNEFAKIDQKCF